jgi:hypothetical protein
MEKLDEIRAEELQKITDINKMLYLSAVEVMWSLQSMLLPWSVVPD